MVESEYNKKWDFPKENDRFSNFIPASELTGWV